MEVGDTEKGGNNENDPTRKKAPKVLIIMSMIPTKALRNMIGIMRVFICKETQHKDIKAIN
jgi:hypothetical protein